MKIKFVAPHERTKDFVRNIEIYFGQDKNRTIHDGRNIIKVVEYENKRYVVKSFKKPHLLNRVVYRFFRKSKAERSYENSLYLQKIDVLTPNPIGYLEIFDMVGLIKSFYISRFIDFDFEIRAVFKNRKFKNRKLIFKEFIKFTYQLHQKGVYHMDYSPGNILVKEMGDRYLFHIIDVNRMKFLNPTLDLRMKNLSKLTNNSEDILLFVEYYAEISNLDKTVLLDRLKFYLNKQSNYLDNKKLLKRIYIKVRQ